MALSKLIEEGSEKGSAHDLLEIARWGGIPLSHMGLRHWDR